MKRNFFTLMAISLASLLMVSCSSSDDNDSGGNDNGNTDYLNLPYSKLTPSAQKKKLSNEGEVIIRQIQDVPNEASVNLIASFSTLSDDLLSLLNDEVKTKLDYTETIIKLSQYYGMYKWNFDREEWEKTGDNVGDKLVAVFPANKKATTNTGKIEVKASGSIVLINGRQVPSKVVADLFVFDAKEGDVTITTKGINETTLVETADGIANLGGYKLTANIDKKNSSNKAKGQFSKGNDIILDMYTDLDANITVEMLQSDDFASNVKDINLTLAIGKELVLAGFIDGKSILPIIDKAEEDLKKAKEENEAIWNKAYLKYQKALDDAYEKYRNGEYDWNDRIEAEKQARKEYSVEYDKIDWYGPEKKYNEVFVTAFNQYTNIALVDKKEDYKIAKLSLETILTDWRASKHIYILNFNDKTPVEATVFFGDGFEKLVQMWEDFTLKFR